MDQLPIYIPIVFGLTTLLAVVLFYVATNNSRLVLLILSGWLSLQAAIGSSGFYIVSHTVPPRSTLLIAPPLLGIILLLVTAGGRRWLDSLAIKYLVLLHIIRIPVEIVLYWLFLHKAVPELMTFEGRNFDVVSGITAPVIFFLGYVKRLLGNTFLLLWNFTCLGLLINIVINALLSAPFHFQQFAFDQPNIAVLYFPFVWLPGCVVPLVLFSHLVTIRQLLKER